MLALVAALGLLAALALLPAPVLAQTAPVITGGFNAVSSDENAPAATNLGTYTATDADGDTLTWSLAGTDGALFTLTVTEGLSTNLRFRVSPDFEDPKDSGANNSYNVTIQVADDESTPMMATRAVTVNVLDVADEPVITTTGNSYTSISKAEKTATSVALATYAATNPGTGTLTWTKTGDDAGDFTITGGVLKFSSVPNFESPADNGTDNGYNVTVNVANDNGSDSVAVTVNVTNVDEAGTASFSGTLSGGSTLTASLTDPDGGIGSQVYQWQRGNTASGTFSAISPNGTSVTYVPVAADVGKWLRVRVNYTDGHSFGSETSAARGPIGASNSAPTFSSMTATRTLAENSGLGVNVVGGTITATDGDGDTLTYSLTGTDAGKFEVDSNGQIKTRSTGNPQNFNFENTSNNSFSVTVRVHDGKDAAGGTDTSTIDDTIAVTINLTNVNEEPDLTSPPTTLSKPENSTAVHEYGATDVDAMTTFTWSVSGADSNKFDISSTGVLTFSNAPDFEAPTDANTDNEYVVTVRVTDNGNLHDQATLRVTVTNINEAPEITSTGTLFTAPSFDENGTSVVATYTATDVDANSNLTWSVEDNDFGDFNITKNADGDGELKFKAPPNYEVPIDADTNNTYSFTVKVRDNHSGQLSDTLPVVVTVNDVNETPVISGGATPSFAEIEFDVDGMDLTVADLTVSGSFTFYDDDGDDVTWTVSGDDGNHFLVTKNPDGSSFIHFKNPSPGTNLKPANFEVPVDMSSGNNYDIVLEANDGQGGVGTFDVTVTVTQVDETPEITSNNPTHTFPEIEYDYAAEAGDRQVDLFTARDEEDGTAGITWTVAGTDAGDFAIATGTVSGSGSLLFKPNTSRNNPDFENPDDDDDDNVYNIILRASDTTSPHKTREYPVTVTVTDVNERPDIDENFNASQTYVEIEYDADTTVSGTLRDVHTFTATDYDDMDTFSWTVTGTDADYLDIGSTSGVLTFTQDSSFDRGPLPNFEHPRDDDTDGTNNTYNVMVVATDNHGKETDYAVVVTVTDVNEVPEFTGTIKTTIGVDEHDANVAAYAMPSLADYDARDEEGGVKWSLTETDSGDFGIDIDNGVVTFAAAPNYEEPDDSGGNNVYEFEVVATDVASGTSRRSVSVDVTVTVADVEEAGTVTVSNVNPAAGDTVIFTLSDPDGGIDLTTPPPGTPPPIDWALQLRSTGGNWQTKSTNNPLGTEFRYVVDEDDTGKEMRAVVTYIDERGPGKRAESDPTAAITADPIPNAPPRFTGDGGTQFIDEVDAGETVGIPITATDRDNDSLTFSIVGAHADKFELVVVNNTTVRLRTILALDFETASGVYFVQVAVHDGKGLDETNMVITVITDDSIDATTTVTVTIVDIEEEGVVTLTDDEPGVGTMLRATLTDGDSINSNGNVTGAAWQWARSGNIRDGWTNISGATSRNYTTTQADADFFVRARVEYTDTRGGGKSAVGITTERVLGENRRPTFPSTESGARTVAENTRAGVSIGAPVAAEDQDNDRLTYALSGTDAAAFSIVTSTGQLRTLEPLDFEDKSSYRVTVEVHDGLDGLGQPSTSIDDTQAVTITIENVEEAGTVTLSSDTGTIQARVPVMATLADDDRPTGTVTWQWARSPSRSNWVNIAGATSDTFTPTLDEDQGKYVRATASYRDGEGQGKTAEGVSPRVGNAPPVNSAPVFPSTENGQREVAENTGSGNVGARFEATDFNNDTLYYSLSGTDAASFEIGQNTGQLRLAPNVALDYEGKRTYRFTVEVSDRADSLDDPDTAIDDRQSVTVTVTNVNEAPEVTGDTAPSFAENGSSVVASYSAADPERDTLTWSVTGSDFWISQRGQLYFRTPPSYEVRESYSVNVMAEDDGGLRDSLPVTVAVTDVEEDGVITLSPLHGWDSTLFSTNLDDGDGGTHSVSRQWARSTNRSSWTDITGATGPTYMAADDDIGNYLRVTMEYTDRRDSGKTASTITAGRIADSADRPTQNNDPAFAETPPIARSVSQGTAAGRSIGSRVRATDPDSGDVLTYVLNGQDADMFDIDTATGQLRTYEVLDYDPDPQGQNTYTVTVGVHDGFDQSFNQSNSVDATVEVTITVTRVTRRPPPPPPPPVEEVEDTTTPSTGGGGGGGGVFVPSKPPAFSGGAEREITITDNAASGANVGEPVTVADAANFGLTYSLTGPDAAFFTIDQSTGQISVAPGTTLDYQEGKNTYIVEVTARNTSGSATTRVTITLTSAVLGPLGSRYDENNNSVIELEEVLAAIADYFEDGISLDQVLEIIRLYFSS